MIIQIMSILMISISVVYASIQIYNTIMNSLEGEEEENK